ncbi:hypothetical protein [Endozoicomonas sp. ALB115]|uniref:hypothetical protein n=1 Tax=Endozoicomonas sp. ALB115 TaxID=3403074 RepID=UPI003BB4941B
MEHIPKPFWYVTCLCMLIITCLTSYLAVKSNNISIEYADAKIKIESEKVKVSAEKNEILRIKNELKIINEKLIAREYEIISYQNRITDLTKSSQKDTNTKDYSEILKKLQPELIYQPKREVIVTPEDFEKINTDLNKINLDYSPIYQQ